ncbi:hypothetical protein LTR37_011381 [Vermiconidia calcicola]|uniref:Uncharacterized protein n=1 Tax=Vermiconidia calcicola TaxID=1690605 RepID=A0ACC3N2H0_9PEZI|nr:hypothetical protein LTR37_011381 [Vermiconidia calcicola]
MASIEWDLLKDRSVIITGGASGIGEQTARKFYQHGAYVTLADLQDDLGQNLAKELGDRATFVHCDTTDWESSAAAFKHAATFAPSRTIDVAVLFAGLDGERRGLVDLVLDQPAPSLDGEPTPARPAHKAIDVNLVGVYISTYLALHYFRLPAKSGQQSFKKSLALISSMTGYMDLPYNTGYATSKYGVRGMFRSIRDMGGKVNARINNIAPGYVLTPLTKKVHQIDDPSQPSKATGFVLPWTPIEHVVDACGQCAVDEGTDGIIDIEEDFDKGYGGPKFSEILESEGITALFPAMFKKQ